MVAVVCQLRSQRAEHIALGAYLVTACGIGRYSLVNIGQVVYREAVAAGAVLQHGVGFHRAGGVVDQLVEMGEFAGRFFGIFGVMRGAVVGGDGVHVLAVELEPVESVVGDEFVNQGGLLAQHVFIYRRERPAEPPVYQLGLSVLAEDYGIGVFAEEFSAGIGGKGRPPELGLEAVSVEFVYHALHVGVAVGETLPGEVPVAFGNLVAVVEGGPFEAQFLHFREGAQYFIYGEAPLVTPCAPGGLVGFGHAHGHLHAHLVEQAGIVAERAEAVAFVHVDEAGVGVDSGIGGDGYGLVELLHQRDVCVVVAGFLHNREADYLGSGLDVAGHHTRIPAPQADCRHTAAVVGVVHAHEVALAEFFAYGLEPVFAVGGGLALERPEVRTCLGRFHFHGAERPSVGEESLAGGVPEGGLHERGGGEVVVDAYGQLPQDCRAVDGFAFEDIADTAAESVGDALLAACSVPESQVFASDTDGRQLRIALEEGRSGLCEGGMEPVFGGSDDEVAGAYGRDFAGLYEEGEAEKGQCREVEMFHSYKIKEIKLFFKTFDISLQNNPCQS